VTDRKGIVRAVGLFGVLFSLSLLGYSEIASAPSGAAPDFERLSHPAGAGRHGEQRCIAGRRKSREIDKQIDYSRIPPWKGGDDRD
jgi:hypothetical protein